MGVNGLWPILSEICEKKPLTYLTGKKVAVDLSGWVVQAFQCKGLNTAKSPHLRNLFFRVSRLLDFGVFPIFVTEGEPPALKEAVFKKRNWDHQTENSSLNNSISRPVFDRTLKECEDLLSTLGVPCIKSSGEAEAFCAFLCLKGIVNGVITEDNDAFLYGADVIYRNISISQTDPHVNVYCLKSEKNKLRLDQKKLVALALLLGCDYSKGVQGIGKETVVKFLSELNCDDVLERLKNWKSLNESELFPGLVNGPLKKDVHCTRCEHLGSSSKHKKEGCSSCNSAFTCYLQKPDNPCRCPWHVNDELMRKWKNELKIYNAIKNDPDFPNMEVIDEYLNFTDTIPSDEVLVWNCPNLINFQDIAFSYLSWKFEDSHKKILPLITSWQQYKLGVNPGDKTNFIYEPVEVLGKSILRGATYYEVKWKVIDDDYDRRIPAENLITKEYGEKFSACYKTLIDDYRQLNEQKEAKLKSKKFKSDGKNRKINEIFKKSHSKNRRTQSKKMSGPYGYK